MDETQRIKYFLEEFYNAYNANRSELEKLYRSDSQFTYMGEHATGTADVVQKLTSTPFDKIRRVMSNVDVQSVLNTDNAASLVVVTGTLLFDNIQPFSFYEVFQLLPNPQGRGYYILNQALRLIY